ncbi:MAG: TnpV protein [Erysipelotrichaceae bacterium]|nr:TnpV protein [Erysipelotrichaceae bacterium]
MNIEYIKVGDYLLPNLAIENQNYGEINEYGYLRLNYIKEHKKGLYQTLLMKNELTNHLLSVSKDCEERLKTLMDNYIKNDGKLSEKSKANNQIEWVKLMNNYKNTAEEIILRELIYV